MFFGSYARGDADAQSDIDMMVLVDAPRSDISRKTWEIGGVAGDILLDRGVVVSPIVENRSYFQQNAAVIPLFRAVLQEGVSYLA